jgi:hypothetical protein
MFTLRIVTDTNETVNVALGNKYTKVDFTTVDPVSRYAKELLAEAHELENQGRDVMMELLIFDNIMIVAEDDTKYYLRSDDRNYICEQGTTVEALHVKFMAPEDWCSTLDRLEIK